MVKLLERLNTGKALVGLVAVLVLVIAVDAFLFYRNGYIRAISEGETQPTTLVGTGDIATCAGTGDEATADLIDGIDGTIFTTGDNAYPAGTDGDFENCYESSWGRHKARTYPSPGNHEYHTSGASG